MPAVAKHRKPIIDAAVRLFRRQGYANTGLNEIVQESGAPKGSLYYYFPEGKTSIAAAAVLEAGERVAKTVQELSGKTASAAQLTRAHAKLLAKWMRDSNYRDGCPITTVLLEMAPQDRAVSEAGRKAYSMRISLMREKLVEDGFPEKEAKRLATTCVSALQGALIQARIERSGATIENVADEIAQMLENHPQRASTVKQ